MEVVTENTNVVLNNKEIYSSDYSNGDGDGKGAAKLKKGIQFAKDSGLLELGASALKNRLGKGSPSKKGTPPPPTKKPSSTPKPAPKKGLSTGAKVGIGIGAFVVLGTIIYFATKGKK